MMSGLFSLRSGMAALALGAVASFSIPVAAQDLRDIPQKTAPAQPQQSPKMQGPPAPLDTQLRDTAPDVPPENNAPSPPPQVQPQPTPDSRTQPSPPGVRRERVEDRTTSLPTPNPRRQASVKAAGQSQEADRQETRTIADPSVAAPQQPSSISGPGAEQAAGDTSSAEDVSPAIPMPVGDDSQSLDARDGAGSYLPWGLGGLALLALGGIFAFTRRKKTSPDDIRLGEQPWRDELASDVSPAVAAAPIKTKPVASKPAKPASAPIAPAALPAKADPVVNPGGLIVSKLRRPVEQPSHQAAPTPPPRPTASRSSVPAAPKVAADGRIVSSRRASEFGAPPAAIPPRRRRSKALPEGAISFGYKMQR